MKETIGGYEHEWLLRFAKPEDPDLTNWSLHLGERVPEGSISYWMPRVESGSIDIPKNGLLAAILDVGYAVVFKNDQRCGLPLVGRARKTIRHNIEEQRVIGGQPLPGWVYGP